MKIRENIDLINWADRMNSKDYHALTNREKRECPIRSLDKSVLACLAEVRDYSCVLPSRTSVRAMLWAKNHHLAYDDQRVQPCLTNAGYILLSILVN